jgi:hypothetical protein
METIRIESGFTSITVRPDPVSFTSAPTPSNLRQQHAATGARVTLEFVRTEPLPLETAVMVRYDIAENGEMRECTGVPQLTHVRKLPFGLGAWHYRVSHWIPAEAVCDEVRLVRPRQRAITASAA